MRHTPSHLYLGGLPKTATTSLESVLPGDNTIGDEAGHSRAWAIPEQIRDRRLVWGTTCPPGLWYARMYLHAMDSEADSLLEGLRAYGCGMISFRSVLHGMTHPDQVAMPYQAGLIFHAPPLSAAALQCSGVGLWTWAHRHFFGAECPSPAEVYPWAVDALVDTMQIEEGVSAILGEKVALPRLNTRHAPLRDWLAGEWDEDMVEWVMEADGALMEELGYRDPFDRREGGAVWRG